MLELGINHHIYRVNYQLAEQTIRNRQVVGSYPTGGSLFRNPSRGFFFYKKIVI